MLQFYFLSIVLNLIAGYLLISGESDGLPEFKCGFSFKDDTFKLIIGIISVVMGLLKLLSVIEDDVPIIGDLFPALAGFLSGFILIFEYYRNRATIDSNEQTEKIDRILVRNKKIIGFAALVAAVLHFVFPKVLLL